MPDLLIRFKKNKDGSAALTCLRSDGSATWQRQNGRLGAVFPPHDLTHYAVETTLGFDHAFFGLIADGWEISDFAASRPAPLTNESLEVEIFVGAFDLERRTGQLSSADEFNEQARFVASRNGGGFVPRPLTEEDLARVRATRADVFAKWAAVEPGSTLELPFDRVMASSGNQFGSQRRL
jgi:hypothetical protein